MKPIAFKGTKDAVSSIKPTGDSLRNSEPTKQNKTGIVRRKQHHSVEYRIGVDVGKTKLAAGLVDMSARKVVDRVTVLTDTAEEGSRIPSQLSDVIAKLIKSTKSRVSYIGIATFGLIDSAHGLAIGGKALTSYRNVPLRTLLRQRFCIPVRIENDVTAAAIGEYFCGLIGNRRSITLVSLGTSAGIASIINGRLLRGVGGRAGQIAHLPFGRQGSATIAETLGGAGLAARAFSIYGVTVNASEAFAFSENGDERFEWLINDWVTGVGDLIAYIVCTLDPALIVLTGGVIQSSDTIVERIRSSAGHALATAWQPLSSPDVRVVRSTLGADGAIIGATLLPSLRG